ncbi:MAG: serine protease Do, partial [Acetobacteraceae bacterium]|nr:serine protease Do [Acetobacteraceae bacterium]
MRLFRSTAARAALLGVSLAFVTPAVPLVQPVSARSAPDSFADLAAKLLPAVVNVSSTQTLTAKNGQGPGAGPEMPIFPPGSPFEQFFKDFLNRNRPGQGGGGGGGDNQPAPRRAQSLGSGFIVDAAG